MDLRQLECFRAVAQTGNITAAARELHVSQPALSMTVSRLEEDLGVRLFDRVNGKILLNSMGKDLLTNVERIFLEVGEIRSKAESLDSTKLREVRFGVNTPGYSLSLLSAYLDQFPPLNFIQEYLDDEALKEKLTKGDLDFAITKGKLASSALHWIPVVEDEVVLLACEKHPLAQRGQVYSQELLNEKFVLNNNDVTENGDFTMLFRHFERKPEICYSGQESAVVMEMAAKGIGLGLVPRLLIHDDPRGIMNVGLRPVRIIDVDMSYTLGLATLRGHYLSRNAYQFYEFTLMHFQNLAKTLLRS